MIALFGNKNQNHVEFNVTSHPLNAITSRLSFPPTLLEINSVIQEIKQKKQQAVKNLVDMN